MRIVMIGPAYPYRGGIGHYTSMMVNALRKRHRVLFLSVSRAYPDFVYPGTTQTDHSKEHVECENEPLLSYPNPLSWRRVAGRALEFEPDLVIMQWPHTAVSPQVRYISGYLRRRKPGLLLLFVCHNVEQHENRFFDRALTRFALKHGNRFIVHDEGSRKILAELKPGARVAVTDLPTLDLFTGYSMPRGEARQLLGIDRDGRVVLFFGHVRPYKGLRQLVRAVSSAAREVPGLHLLVAGEFWENKQDYFSELERSGLLDRCTLVDEYVPNEEVAKYFCACDLVALPYVTATGSGILQIAYAFSKPVVATSVGSLPSAVEQGKTGYLVAPGDPDAMGAAIVEFFGRDDSPEFAKNIERYRGRFSWENMVAAIEKLCSRPLR